ncbi:ribonuclease HI family protein [Candidatus Methylomirabilis sp.]|uniref:Ribonuclease HI family protein n=1 Tax=Candidatus Methylomirabilis tolerans TaxID=3123416 RepID=A0AAJ1AGT1_9BACT|nr:ribonuclease HI family protein [Candidatus Methylomirabilis sp.]
MTDRHAGELSDGPAPQALPEPRRMGLQLMIHIDGAARGNPGPAGIGVMVNSGNGLLRRDFYRYIGKATNNVAEYEALLLALREAKELQPAVVEIRSDSQLLVRQIQGRYRVRHPRLAVLYAQALNLIHQLSAVGCRLSIEHVGRELNRQADALANRAIDEALAGIPRDGERS